MLTAIISTVVVSALWIAGIAIFYYAMSGSDPAFAVRMIVPPQANVGDNIYIEMEVTNPTDSLLELDSIDLEDSLLGGFKVSSVFPAPTDTSRVMDSTTYSYSEALSAGETFKISFLLEAVKPGIWTGDVDFCNPSQDFVTSSATVRVNAAGTVATLGGSADGAEQVPPFVLDIVTPHTVTLGENFTLRASVSNPTDSSRVLECIDFDETLSKGFEFQRIEPAPEAKLLDEDDPSLVWAKSLAPGESFTASIELKAVKEGIWTGDLSFWDGNSEGYVSSSVTIRVKPAPGMMPEATKTD
ncbi:MAG: hypothetical protein V4819_13905 [Verrucomicrobiota bacterium]